MSRHDTSTQEIEYAWKQFDESNSSNIVSNSKESVICKSCNKNAMYYTNDEIICNNCGMVQSSIFSNSSNCTFLPAVSTFGHKTNTYSNGSKNAKLLQMQEWKMWSNEEKNTYKLVNYTKTLCAQLNIPETLLPNIYETVTLIINTIKKNDGTKRARVKDGIILVCIEYVCNNSNYNISSIDMAKRLKLDIKYVSKAEKMVLDLLNNNKINLNKNDLLSIKEPYYYIENVINQKGLQIPFNVLNQVKRVIDICEQNDILLDHTPLSIGVCCFYYVLLMFSIDIDVKLFSEIYNLSIVTIVKTTNKLKAYEDFIKNKLMS